MRKYFPDSQHTDETRLNISQLAVDFFSNYYADEDTKHEQLVSSLDTITNLINPNGTLLIIDVEKREEEYGQDADAHSCGFANERLKYTGSGSAEIVKALEELGMEDIDVVGDQHFHFQVKQGDKADSPMLSWMETYFLLKAKRGSVYEQRLFQRCEGFHQAM